MPGLAQSHRRRAAPAYEYTPGTRPRTNRAGSCRQQGILKTAARQHDRHAPCDASIALAIATAAVAKALWNFAAIETRGSRPRGRQERRGSMEPSPT